MTPAEQFLLAATPDPESDHRAGNLAHANEILVQHPDLASDNFAAACVLGNLTALQLHLANDPALATAPAGPRGWPPLCYLTFSKYLRLDASRSGDFLRAAKLLLDHGADPNAHWTLPSNPSYKEPALYGAAGLANDPAITQLLLSHGADPNDEESLYHASEFDNPLALGVLLNHPNLDPDKRNYCFCHSLDYEHRATHQLYLDHGADPNHLITRGQRKGDRPLHFALVRHRSDDTIKRLLENRANPNLADSRGITPYSLAMRLGRPDTALLLTRHGATDIPSPYLQLLCALSAGNREHALTLVQQHPSLLNQLTEDDKTILMDAAANGHTAAVELMLSPPFNFPVEMRKPAASAWDGTPLHHACYHAHPQAVQLLLQNGANPHLLHHYGGNALTTTLHAALHNNPEDLPQHLETLTHLKPYFPAEEINRALSQLPHETAKPRD
jgi:ankyrin repeat protein